MLKCGRKSTGSSAPGLQTASYPGVGGGGGGPAALLPGRHLYPYSSPKRSVWSQARWIWPQTPARSQQPDAVAPAPPKLLTHSFNSDSVSPHRWSAGQLRLHVPKPELSLFPSQPPPLLSSVHPAAQFRNVGVFPENPLPPHSLHASDSTSSLDWPSGPLCAHLCPPQQPPNCSVPSPAHSPHGCWREVPRQMPIKSCYTPVQAPSKASYQLSTKIPIFFLRWCLSPMLAMQIQTLVGKDLETHWQ